MIARFVGFLKPGFKVSTDPDVRAIQREILAAMRSGKRFATCHKEGGTNIRFHGSLFVISNYGEDESLERYSSEDSFLAALRKFYDCESRRDIHPRRPSEIEVWKYIQGQLF